MEDILKVFKYNGRKIKTFVDDKNVARALEYKEYTKCVRKYVSNEDKIRIGDLISIPSILDGLKGNEKNAIYINQSGLFALIMQSKMKTAEKFKRWVLSEVLPQICAKGYYIHPDIDQENIDDAKEALAEREKIIAEYEKKLADSAKIIEENNKMLEEKEEI